MECFLQLQDSLSSYDSFNKQTATTNNRIGPNAHDDLKTTLSKIEPTQNSPSKYQQQHHHQHQNTPPRWEHRKYGPPDLNSENSPRSSMIDPRLLENRGGSAERDVYRYSRSPAKTKGGHVETKTDYGKYSRNNQDYGGGMRQSSQQDLSQQQGGHLSVVQTSHHHNATPLKQPQQNGFDGSNVGPNGYKPVPPPKPKNYKPPHKQQGYGGEQAPAYQHGKSHSNPVVSAVHIRTIFCFRLCTFIPFDL